MKKIVLLLLRRSCILLIVVCVISLCYDFLTPKGIPWLTPVRVIRVGEVTQKVPLFIPRRELKTTPATVPLHAIAEVSLTELTQMLQEAQILLLDTRSYADYCAGHIPGAFSLPYEDFIAGTANLVEIDPNQKIVTYCEGPNCSQSIDLAVRLGEMGFRDVYFYYGGWEEWKAHHNPIVKGRQP